LSETQRNSRYADHRPQNHERRLVKQAKSPEEFRATRDDCAPHKRACDDRSAQPVRAHERQTQRNQRKRQQRHKPVRHRNRITECTIQTPLSLTGRVTLGQPPNSSLVIFDPVISFASFWEARGARQGAAHPLPRSTAATAANHQDKRSGHSRNNRQPSLRF
jgi:hypothetical protein